MSPLPDSLAAKRSCSSFTREPARLDEPGGTGQGKFGVVTGKDGRKVARKRARATVAPARNLPGSCAALGLGAAEMRDTGGLHAATLIEAARADRRRATSRNSTEGRRRCAMNSRVRTGPWTSRRLALSMIVAIAATIAPDRNPHGREAAGRRRTGLPMRWAGPRPPSFTTRTPVPSPARQRAARALVAERFASGFRGKSRGVQRGDRSCRRRGCGGHPLHQPRPLEALLAREGDGLSPVIFDTDGSIID